MIARLSILIVVTMLSSPVLATCPLPSPATFSAAFEAAKGETHRRRYDRARLEPRIEALTVQDKAYYVADLAKGPTQSGYERAMALTFTVAQRQRSSGLLRYLIDYDGDGYSVVRILAHDIDDPDLVRTVVDTFSLKSEDSAVGIKLLSDVDDTIYANLVDPRYEKTGRRYPGVEALYRAIAVEPAETNNLFPDRLALTTLSARPETRGFDSVKASLRGVSKKFDHGVCAMSLGGELLSSGVGTFFTILVQGSPPSLSEIEDLDERRERFAEGKDRSSDSLKILGNQEAEIGRVKFSNYKLFAMVYPEYDYVFFGDSGQADAYAAQLIMENNDQAEGVGKAILTFIHDLRVDRDDGYRRGMSPTVVVQEAVKRSDVVLFRNHIQAALIAFNRGQSGQIRRVIVDAEELVGVVKEALDELPLAEFKTERIGTKVRAQFASDAADSILAVSGAGENVSKEVLDMVADACDRYGAVCPVLR